MGKDGKVSVSVKDLIRLTESVPSTLLLEMYATMLRIRKFEEKVADLILTGDICCPSHLYIGQEAIATGACAVLTKDDCVFPTYRSHGTFIAKGGSLKELMAEIYGKETGCSNGKGGSMHVVSPEIGILGTTAIVGGNIPLAVGAALALEMEGTKGVSVAFFGDGATDEGIFQESLNFAALKQLPVIFICENNYFSTHLPLSLRKPANNISDIAKAHCLPSRKIHGNDVLQVFHAVGEAVNIARQGKGPSFIECETFRWRAHVGAELDIDVGFRTKELVEEWIGRCPIISYENLLMEEGLLCASDKKNILNAIKDEVEESVRFAKESCYPDEAALSRDLFRTL